MGPLKASAHGGFGNNSPHVVTNNNFQAEH